MSRYVIKIMNIHIYINKCKDEKSFWLRSCLRLCLRISQAYLNFVRRSTPPCFVARNIANQLPAAPPMCRCFRHYQYLSFDLHSRSKPETHSIPKPTISKWGSIILGVWSYLGHKDTLTSVQTVAACSISHDSTFAWRHQPCPSLWVGN